jgi:hypothetical protein
MPKRKDENETAFDALQEVLRRDAERDGMPLAPVAESAKIPYRVEAGRKGGTKGGKARAEKLSEKKRTEIARKAAKARWSKKKQPS